MTITKEINQDTITLKIEGWLDVESTPQLNAYMKELEASEKLVFDFAELEYISSSGVREVIAAYRRQKEAGGSFEVIHVRHEVMDVFSMTGLTGKLSISQ